MIVFGTILIQIGLGTIYTWSLFNQPLADKFGWKLSSVAITFSITSFALAVATLFAGRLQEKWGLRSLIALAGIVLGAGLIASSFVSSLLVLYVTAGVIVGFADGLAYITSLSNLIKWFPERKGLISGISVSAYGMGSLLFKYINTWLLDHVGASQTFMYWGIIVMAMVLIGSRFVREAPEPAGIDASSLSNSNNYTVKEMMRTKEVYLLFVMFFTACMSGLYLISIAKDVGVQLAGLDADTAANAVAMIAIFNTIGRLILGALSDKISRMKVIAFSFLVTAAAVLVLTLGNISFGLFFTCVAGIAFCFGGNITVFPAIVGDFFGLKNHNKNYSIVYQGFGLGALSGSFIAAIINGFRPTFMIIAVLCIASFIIALRVKPPNAREEKPL
nr:OFA family MFS transporter [Peribacillus muralis]